MRRIRQALDAGQCEAVLRRATSGVLSLHGDGGYPYGVPLSYVYADGHLYFHSALRGHKIDAVGRNDKASFTVIDLDEVHPDRYTTFFRSVVCFGRVHVVSDAAEKQRLATLLGQRYNPGDDEGLAQEMAHAGAAMLMLDFTIDHMSGKQAKELVAAAHRP